jgi:hypothetical protein
MQQKWVKTHSTKKNKCMHHRKKDNNEEPSLLVEFKSPQQKAQL